MNNDLKQCLKEKRAAFLIEEEKEFPDDDLATELKAEIVTLENADMVLNTWRIEQAGKRAQKLCDTTDRILEACTIGTFSQETKEYFELNDDNDAQRLGH